MTTEICAFLIILIIIIIIYIGPYYLPSCHRVMFVRRPQFRCRLSRRRRNDTLENGNYAPTLSVVVVLISKNDIDAGNRYKIVNLGTITNRYVNVRRHIWKHGIGSG